MSATGWRRVDSGLRVFSCLACQPLFTRPSTMPGIFAEMPHLIAPQSTIIEFRPEFLIFSE